MDIKSDSEFTFFLIATFAILFIWCLIKVITIDPENLEMRLSSLTGKKYGIQEMLPNADVTPDLIGKLDLFAQKFIEYLKRDYPNDKRVLRLIRGMKHTQMEESPFVDDTSSYTVNKGELIALCVRNKDDKGFHDDNTMLFVFIHELAHVASITTGHNTEFIENFRWLLERAHEANLYDPVDYSKSPITYCGVRVTNNPML